VIDRAIRVIAVLIALLAVLDPPVTLQGRSRPRLAVLIVNGSSMDLPAVDGTNSRRAAAARVRETLRRDLSKSYELVDGLDRAAAGVIVVGDQYPETSLPEPLRAWTVTVGGELTPNVRILRVDAPAFVPAATAVQIRPTIEAVGVRGMKTVVSVRTGGVDVGRATHEWLGDRDSWSPVLDVVPIGEPPFAFEIAAERLPSERTTADNQAVVHVDRSTPIRVAALEARPSWASAFVRRALENDPRFVVSGVSRASPRAVVRTDGGAWPLAQPDSADVVLVGGLDLLTGEDVDALRRFVELRGGAVVLLPDRTPRGSALRLIPDRVALREVLLERPSTLDSTTALRLEAAELLESDRLPLNAEVLATSPASHRAVVWSVSRGEGRVLFAGAMDSWRSRAVEGAGFDRFWRGVVAGLGLNARRALEVTLTPRHAAPGERVVVRARIRALERERIGDALSVAAQTPDGDPIRMWPDASPGSFVGTFLTPPRSFARSAAAARRGDGPMFVSATADGIDARASVRLFSAEDIGEAPAAPLSLLATSHAGIDVAPSNVADLESHIRRAIAGSSIEQRRYPMRSPWWVVPFTLSLCLEWWLRRRRGLR
jgi:hypothetical protein